MLINLWTTLAILIFLPCIFQYDPKIMFAIYFVTLRSVVLNKSQSNSLAYVIIFLSNLINQRIFIDDKIIIFLGSTIFIIVVV